MARPRLLETPALRGRPPLPEGKAREHRCTVRLNDDDALQLEQLARTLGCSEADALRQALRIASARTLRS